MYNHLKCMQVMNGISAFSLEEKEATAQACGAAWPCFGTAFLCPRRQMQCPSIQGETLQANARTQILQDRSPVLRSTTDPAEYTLRSGKTRSSIQLLTASQAKYIKPGPIDNDSGAIHEQSDTV